MLERTKGSCRGLKMIGNLFGIPLHWALGGSYILLQKTFYLRFDPACIGRFSICSLLEEFTLPWHVAACGNFNPFTFRSLHFFVLDGGSMWNSQIVHFLKNSLFCGRWQHTGFSSCSLFEEFTLFRARRRVLAGEILNLFT